MSNLLSFSKMLQEQDKKEKEKQENWETGRPKPVDQETSVVDQETGPPVDQTTSRPVEQTYPSRKERIKIGVRLPAHKVEKYKLWCFVNKVDLQDAIEKGMDWVTGGLVDQSTAINDLDDIDDVMNDDALIFYQRWTKNKITEKDKQAAEEVKAYAPHVVKAGILMSIVRSKSKINSFRYCIGAIQEVAESDPSPEYFSYLLSQMKRKM